MAPIISWFLSICHIIPLLISAYLSSIYLLKFSHNFIVYTYITYTYYTNIYIYIYTTYNTLGIVSSIILSYPLPTPTKCPFYLHVFVLEMCVSLHLIRVAYMGICIIYLSKHNLRVATSLKNMITPSWMNTNCLLFLREGWVLESPPPSVMVCW